MVGAFYGNGIPPRPGLARNAGGFEMLKIRMPQQGSTPGGSGVMSARCFCAGTPCWNQTTPG